MSWHLYHIPGLTCSRRQRQTSHQRRAGGQHVCAGDRGGGVVVGSGEIGLQGITETRDSCALEESSRGVRRQTQVTRQVHQGGIKPQPVLDIFTVLMFWIRRIRVSLITCLLIIRLLDIRLFSCSCCELLLLLLLAEDVADGEGDGLALLSLKICSRFTSLGVA